MILLAAGCKLAAGAHATDAGATALGFTVDLPKAANSEQVSTYFNVAIAADGSLAVNGVPVKDTSEVITRAQAAKEAVPDVSAYIDADKSVLYARVIEVMDAIRAGGITKVAFGVAPIAPVPATRTPTPLGR